jgi:hypothetical protein
MCAQIRIGDYEESLQIAEDQRISAISAHLLENRVTRIYSNLDNWIQAERKDKRHYSILWLRDGKRFYLNWYGFKKSTDILENYRRGKLGGIRDEYPWNEDSADSSESTGAELDEAVELSEPREADEGLDGTRKWEGAECIYILCNESMPGVIKIGRSDRGAAHRARELSAHTGVPTDYSVFRSYSVRNSIVAEKAIHDRLSTYRVSSDREFFRLEPEDAAAVIEEVLTVSNREQRSFEEIDDLFYRAQRIALIRRQVWHGMLCGELKISYDEADTLMWKLQALGIIDSDGNVPDYWRPAEWYQDRARRRRMVRATKDQKQAAEDSIAEHIARIGFILMLGAILIFIFISFRN